MSAEQPVDQSPLDQAEAHVQVELDSTEIPSELSVLQEQLAAAQQKIAEQWDQGLRARAELDNAQKRAQRDLENAHKYSIEKMALDILSVRDSLELGLAAADKSNDIATLREGVDLTLKQLAQAMERYQIKVLDPINEKFNPDWHQAMSMQESAEQPANTIIQVLQKGYRLHERLLRPALVVIAKAPAN
ncbi:MAG: nucleotide exchange factor GrpE [Gammaproteobacteria bacterium]|nr:nucleotide exchange factor GrpE [Gammaproteobacteria bacterium]